MVVVYVNVFDNEAAHPKEIHFVAFDNPLSEQLNSCIAYEPISKQPCQHQVSSPTRATCHIHLARGVEISLQA